MWQNCREMSMQGAQYYVLLCIFTFTHDTSNSYRLGHFPACKLVYNCEINQKTYQRSVAVVMGS